MKALTPDQSAKLLETLRARFAKNMARHAGVEWSAVEAKLLAAPDKLASLFQMEETGGEPDVVILDPASEAITFVDCAPQSPAGRRSLCYDDRALEERKEHKPKGSAAGTAAEMGIELITEAQFFALQGFGEFDTKTSSWLKTDPEVRKEGGAIFGDRRYNRVFIFHNGADSYYAARGFRGVLTL